MCVVCVVCVVCVQALQFQRSLDDMERCVGSVERELMQEEQGSDLPSVNRLLKALQGLEEEVDGHRDRVQVSPAPSLPPLRPRAGDG